MLTATPEIDTSLAQTQWDDFVNQAGEGLDKVVGKGNKLDDKLGQIGDEAKKTASAVASIDLAQKMEKAVGHIGDVKDILQKAGGAVFGFSKETTEAIGKVGDLAEKGAALGSAFGPIGAVVGAGLGTVVGVFTAYTEATEKARAAQEQFIRDTVANSFVLMQKQRTIVQANIKTWEDYALAVRRAGGVQVSIIEGVLATEEAATKTQVDQIQLRIDAYQKNIDTIKDLTKGRVRTSEEAADLVKNENGLVKVQIELYHTKKDALDAFNSKTMPDLKRAFENSDKATEDFNKELAKIGKTPTLKDLKTDLDTAQTELTEAETKVKNLKEELAAGPKEEEGFFAYMSRLKGLLVDSQNAASGLAEAQGKVLTAKTNVTNAKGKGGKSERQLNKEANEEFERQLRNSEDQAR